LAPIVFTLIQSEGIGVGHWTTGIAGYDGEGVGGAALTDLEPALSKLENDEETVGSISSSKEQVISDPQPFIFDFRILCVLGHPHTK
jgi:hypothetical protein